MAINSFRYQIDYLKEKYKVIAVDSRCQGRTSCNKTKLSYVQMADDMNLLLDSLQINNASVLGWSDGGNTGILMAMKYKNRIKKLIVMGAVLNPTENAIKSEIIESFKKNVKQAKVVGLFNKQVRNYAQISSMCLKHPNINPEELNSVEIPVLVLAGENDVVLESHTRLIADNLKYSELHILSGLTHDAPIENPVVFNEIVDSFLERN